MVKSFKIFSETMRPTLYIFSMKQLVVPYINPANQATGVQTSHAIVMNSSHTYNQTFKNLL